MELNSIKFKFFCLLLLIVILFNASALQTYSEDELKNILILNSYHKGFSWTDNETEGISKIIKMQEASSNIWVEYMDWKNYPTEENLKQLYTQLEYKYSDKHMDVIITTDDAALDFALKNRARIFSDAPIVFCGVNARGINKLSQGHSRVTGVSEIIDPERTIRAALEINPELKEIYVLFDNTESGMSTGDITIQTIKNINSNIKINTINEMSLKEVLAEVAKAGSNSAIIITTYYMDSDGVAIGFENFSRKVSESSKVPVFHLYDFGMNNGAIGGSMLSGMLQGEAAGRIAVEILKGSDISRIPIETTQTTNYIFDYVQLERFDISMDKVPKGSTIVNKPFSFLEEYKHYILMAIGTFVLLLIFIIILIFYLSKISIMKSELEKKHQELIASENMLRQQFDELTKVQHSLTSTERGYSLLFEKMLNAFAIVEPVFNEDGKIVDVRFINVNPGFMTQMMMNNVDIIGMTWMEVFKYPNKNLKIYHNILRTGEAEHFDTYYSAINVYYSANAFKISDNQIGVVFDNITEYKQAIEEITTLNEKLEQRVAERTEELQVAVNELEAFTYTVSHDLKSPLRAVDGYSRILQEDFEPKLGEEGIEIIGNIRHICRDMIDMIIKLLKYSTTSKADIVREEIDTKEMFQSIISELILANPDRAITLTVDTGMPIIYADRILIRQALYNILSNAVKFTKHREIAIINIGCTITAEEYIFYVKDNGVGFDMEFLNKLFGIFQRLHTSDEFEGSGIGLVTVKKIIQKHGGQVWIEGKPGVGATVNFTMPFKK